MDFITLALAKKYTDEAKVIVELPMEYDMMFLAGEFAIDAETGAELVRAAENCLPVYLKSSSGGAEVVHKFEISASVGGIYVFECFSVSRGSAFADTFQYNANNGMAQAVSYTLSIAGTTGG